MSRTAALALAFALAAAAAGRTEAPYAPSEGDFSVAFPNAPSVTSQPAHRSHDVAHRRYFAQEPSRAMEVAIDDYPQGELPQVPDAGVYDKILRTRAENENAQLVFTRAARLAGRPCLEGALLDMNGVAEEVRVLIVGDRMYQLTYIHPDGIDPAGADAAFFGSFKITAPDAASAGR